MKLCSVTVNGFRAWAGSEHFDLDADAVIVIAPNGQGKTSLFDAILWSLTGSVPRLGADRYIVSKYNESGQASVTVELRDDITRMRISRLYDGTTQLVQVEIADRTYKGSAAENQILEALWPAAMSAPSPVEALIAAFTKCIYLQQDLIRDFIQDEDDQGRYNAVSEIIGTGRITELQLQLDRAKTQWTKATNSRYEEAAEFRRRLQLVQGQLQGLDADAADSTKVQESWIAWWRRAEEQTGLQPEVSADSTRASSSLDRALKQLQARHLAVGREADQLIELRTFLESAPAASTNKGEEAVRTQLGAINERISKLQEAQDRARDEQRKYEAAQLELAKRKSELVELATIALRHLDGRCPVCDQDFERAKTRKRLLATIRKAGVPLDVSESGLAKSNPFIGELEELQSRRVALNAELRLAIQEDEHRRAWESELSRRLASLKLARTAGLGQEVAARSELLRAEATKLTALVDSGEALAMKLAVASEAQRRGELVSELVILKQQVDKAESDRSERIKTGELAGKMLEALRSASYDLVSEQLSEIGLLLQQIYETADPHPAFKAVRLVMDLIRGRGRLGTEISDPDTADVKTTAPQSILSGSQYNVLAVAMFLAMNLSVKGLPVNCAILDDPLQSLDDLNLLGLVDVLRQVKDRRQLFISTHDERFGGLLRRKLRPVGQEQRTRVIEIRDWSRQGPTVRQYDALRGIDGRGQSVAQ